MAEYRITIKDQYESEIKSTLVSARNRKEAIADFVRNYGSYIDARTARLEIENTKK